MIGRLPLRVRVAAGFAVASAAVLVALGVFVHVRVDASLRDQAREALTARLDTLAPLPLGDQVAAVERLGGGSFGQLLAADGRVLAFSPGLESLPSPLPTAADDDAVLDTTVLLRGEDEPEAAVVVVRRTGERVLVLGSSSEATEDALDGLLAQLAVGIPLAVLLSTGVGYVLAGAALRPMERMRRRAATLSAFRPGDRLPLPDADDEVRRLGRTLNEMLDRLEATWERERRFHAEAGHELRTPLALLRTELDLALSRPRSHQELLAAVRSASEEVDRLHRLAEDLLTRARGGAGPPGATEVDVPGLLASVQERFAGTATEAGRRVVVEGRPEGLLDGDGPALDRAVTNLVDNALRHGSGTVRLSAHVTDDDVVLGVADDGPAGGDGTSGQGTSSQGLGLAIAREVARSHGGSVDVDLGGSTGAGSSVTLRLPRRPPQAR